MLLHVTVDVLLWYNVLSLAIWFGGTIYQMVVVVPLWNARPPDSVRRFFTETRYTATINNFFGRRTQVLRVVPLALLLVFGWAYPELRLWLAISALAMAIALAMTLAYIYQINDTLIFKAGGDLSGEAIVSLARSWIVGDRLRFAIMSIGFLSLLYAFRVFD
jgi:hypothetical protein